jgi:hypothetical protein
VSGALILEETVWTAADFLKEGRHPCFAVKLVLNVLHIYKESFASLFHVKLAHFHRQEETWRIIAGSRVVAGHQRVSAGFTLNRREQGLERNLGR